MKQFIREYFTFNKRERNGLFVLLTIILLEIIYLNISHLFHSTEKVDFTKFEAEIKKFEEQKVQTLTNYKLQTVNLQEQTTNSQQQTTNYFNFNPNNLSVDDWKRLGLSDKQIKVIKNYEAKGGKFYSKNDFKKMYCIPEKQYLALEPYISISNSQSAVYSSQPILNSHRDKKTKIEIVELNSSDSLKLLSLKGIGAFYAKTILKYRNQLGGFYSKKQLLEVWKFDENKLQEMENLISVDSSMIKKVNINTCDAKQLKHPYLKWNQVNAIINYRNKHGHYNSINEIKNTDLIDEETFKKISHYLTI